MYLEKLLAQTPEAAYWMGFLMADGSFDGKRLKIALSDKDAEHLQKFVNFLGHPRKVSVSNGVAYWSLQEPDAVAKIMQIFDINKNKTYEPPDGLPSVDLPDYWTCFLIGFIDGDGTITYQSGRESVCLRTVSHPLWLTYISELSQVTRFGKVSVRGDGYIQLASHKHNDIVKLKQYAISRDLPVIERKWNRVNEGLTVRGGLRYTVLELLEQGMTPKEIISKTGCSPAYISVLKKRKAGGLYE